MKKIICWLIGHDFDYNSMRYSFHWVRENSSDTQKQYAYCWRCYCSFSQNIENKEPPFYTETLNLPVTFTNS